MNGIRLPAGFTSRVVATSGQPVAGTVFPWHPLPDGAATFPMDDGGWAYASNSEIFAPGGGSVGVLRFDGEGEVSDAYRILQGTTANCSGGRTPWGTWLSCEETPLGQVYECDPAAAGNGTVRPALGVFSHEAVAVDPDEGRLYLTEDDLTGGGDELYRFTPDAALPDLSAGTLEVCVWDPSTKAVTWLEVDPIVPAQTRRGTAGANVGTTFEGGEGVWYDDGHLYFTTKEDDRVWYLDIARQHLEVLWDAAVHPSPVLSGVDNLVMGPTGDLYVCEDGGNMELVVITWDRKVAPFLRIEGQDGSEISGPAFDPTNRRLYFSSARGGTGGIPPEIVPEPGKTGNGIGLTYEVTGPFMWFRDVTPTHSFFDEIGCLAAAGIAHGYDDRTYRSSLPVTRQAMAAFLHRIAGAPEGPFPDPGFPDVGPTHPFRSEIAWLADQGITTGFANGRFKPAAPISRQAMAAFLHRFQGSPVGPFPDAGFSDVSDTHSFAVEIDWMAQSGITTGFEDGTYRPSIPVSRQAMAAFLCRLMEEVDDAANPFRHGVASGDPTADAVLLWTRVTPVPEASPGSGVGPAVQVGWEVATTAGFGQVVASGTVPTSTARDHTVKVDVDGLDPATTYWYRFTYDGAGSPVGRTRTAPALGSDPANLRFGAVSCANYEGGFFSAYRHLAERDDLDFVLHLGDYVYEYGNGEYGPGPEIGRLHEPATEMVALADYRRRHAQYKRDPDLRRLHARHPFIVTLDDHEVADNSWRDGAENHTPATEGAYASRRAAAYQAYLEYLPIREEAPGLIERRLRFGDLADLFLLDLRRYRDEQVAAPTDAVGINDPNRTITGTEQMTWLKDGLTEAGGPQWRLVGNPVMVTPVSFPSLPGPIATLIQQLTGAAAPIAGQPYNVDQWDGYAADRAELLDHLVDEGIDDVVFLTGDIHSSWACDVPRVPGSYPLLPGGESVATELVVPSVTSDNLDDIAGSPPRTTSVAVENAFKLANPHVKLLEFDSHGYTVVDVTSQRLHMDWWYVSDREDVGATQVFGQAWKVSAGSNQVSAAAGPLP